MLITQIRPKEKILPEIKEKTLAIKCIGCREIYFPDKDIDELIKDAAVDWLDFDYLCNHEFTRKRTEKYKDKITDAQNLLVFSCGVGVQTTALLLEGKIVIPGCDTLNIPGFQGLTSQNYNCDQCGECYLNQTGGLCPLTACSKGLLNGPCGGAKGGKCEVNKEMECGWDEIYRRLERAGRTKDAKTPVSIRKYSL